MLVFVYNESNSHIRERCQHGVVAVAVASDQDRPAAVIAGRDIFPDGIALTFLVRLDIALLIFLKDKTGAVAFHADCKNMRSVKTKEFRVAGHGFHNRFH